MKKIIKCLSFSVLALTMVFLSYKVLSWKDTSGAYVSVTKQLYNTKKDMIDVAFVGSSHVYTSVYPAYLWNSYGISAFDMSLSEQDKICSYYCLKELLKTQKPKVVCLEMYGLTFEGHNHIGDEYRNMLSLRSSLNSLDFVKNGYTTQKPIDYILRWPIVHTRYKELDRYDFRSNEINNYSRGAIMGWGRREAGYMNPDTIAIKDESALSSENIAWLDSFVELSKDYGFDLVFFLAPDFQSPEQRVVTNAAKSYAFEHGIAFFDFTELAEELSFDPATDMGDLLHCNAEGAFKITSYFGKYLDENYDLVDHRGDDRYHQWEDDYVLFEQINQENAIYLSAEDEDYLDVLADSKNLVVLLSLDGEFENCIEFMQKFNVPYEECINGGKWIYKNGQASKIMDNTPGESHIVDINRYDAIKVQCAPLGGDSMSNILFGLDQMMSTENGLNVFVYDEIMCKPISKRGMSY